MPHELKKIGHNIDLKNIVIHQVIKEQSVRDTVLKKAQGLLKIGEKEKMFVGRINKVYHQKSSPIYGIFGNDDETFKNLIKKYQKDNDFYIFSIDALSHYEKKLKTEISSTGGFVIFAHFINTDNKNENLLVLTANNKNSYVVNENDLTINDSKNLELNKLDVACMINISKWKSIELGIDKESKTYLSFVKGNKEVSYYFMAFIDCNNKQTGSEASQRLVKAINEFCTQKGYDRATKVNKEREVYSYCEECMNNKKEIQLSMVSSLLDPENPNEFQEFASDETYGVSAVISGDKSKIKYIKYTMYRNKDIVIEFDKKLLGKEVVYNSQKNELTFKNLPEELVNQIPK
jgi:nucleoid-associated protein YejK